MTLLAVSELKRKLATETEFGEIWRHYFDQFAENEAFLKLGRRVRSPDFERVISNVGFRLLVDEIELRQVMLTEIPEYSMLHGACLVNGHVAAVLFFADIDMGLLAITLSVDEGRMLYGRFTTRATNGSSRPN
jgi:hypothetical protein